MEKNKTNAFISYLDDDGRKKDVWCTILEKTTSYVIFEFMNERLTIPFHRVLKIKEKEFRE